MVFLVGADGAAGRVAIEVARGALVVIVVAGFIGPVEDCLTMGVGFLAASDVTGGRGLAAADIPGFADPTDPAGETTEGRVAVGVGVADALVGGLEITGAFAGALTAGLTGTMDARRFGTEATTAVGFETAAVFAMVGGTGVVVVGFLLADEVAAAFAVVDFDAVGFAAPKVPELIIYNFKLCDTNGLKNNGVEVPFLLRGLVVRHQRHQAEGQ